MQQIEQIETYLSDFRKQTVVFCLLVNMCITIKKFTDKKVFVCLFVFTFRCLDNADFQTLECFAGQLLQRAQRRGGRCDPVPRRVGARHFL